MIIIVAPQNNVILHHFCQFCSQILLELDSFLMHRRKTGKLAKFNLLTLRQYPANIEDFVTCCPTLSLHVYVNCRSSIRGYNIYS